MKRAVLILVITTGLVSCGPRFPVAEPDVSIVDLTIDEVKLLETSFDITLRIANENPIPIFIDGAVYRIYLNGVSIGKGMSDASFEVPRLSSVTDRVTFRASNVAMGMKFKSIIDMKEFDYEIDGDLYVEVEGRSGRLKIHNRGHFSFNQ